MGSYTPERWAFISELLADVLLQPEDERMAFLADASSGDDALRVEVERLLESYKKADSAERFSHGALDLVPLAFPERDLVRQVGPYRLIREIGRGGMGAVWLAHRSDGVYDQDVAVKMMQSGFFAGDSWRRFEAERRILARLDHPNIARILDGGVADGGQPYFVMEYVEGFTITDYCRKHALDVDERLKLFLTVCHAVAYAHQKLIVHRDLKPSNIPVTETGDVKLLDFGIAKLLSDSESESRDHAPVTRTGMSLMTPEYAAPEQVTGGVITTATDVYSLGVLLFELLTGKRPYQIDSSTPSGIEQAICHSDPVRPSTAARTGLSGSGIDMPSERIARKLRGDLDVIVLKALRKEPDRRYGSAEQLAEEVRRYLRGQPISARPDTLGYRTTKFARRYWRSVLAAAVFSMTLIAGIAATSWQANIAVRERARAERRFDDVRQLANTFLFEFYDAIRDLPGATSARELVIESALEYLDKLVQESEADPELQMELATAYRRVGDVQGNPTNANLGRTQDALESYRKAISILENSTAPRAETLPALALTLEKLADVQATSGDLDAAHASLREAIDGYRRLAEENPSEHENQTRYAVGLIKQGDLSGNPNFPNRGEASAALERYRASKSILEGVHSADSTNARAFRLLGLVEERLGSIYDLTGADSAALEAFRRSLEIRNRYAALRPNDLDAIRDLAIAHEKMGLAAASSGDLEEARRRLGHATEVFRRLAAADSQNVQGWQSLAVSLMHQGDHVEHTDGSFAPPQFREALHILEDLRQSHPTSQRTQELTERVKARLAAVRQP